MKKNILVFLSLLFLTGTTLPAENGSTNHETLAESIKNAIQGLIEDNAAFANSKSTEHFSEFADVQNPRVTMLLCSDSRVQVDNFSQGAENDIFVVRNIGNQYPNNPGSVEYGVNVLETPVLLIVGHSHCGAIKAAMKDYKHLPANIQKELHALQVKAAKDDKQGVIMNVHQQVQKALGAFKKRVNEKKLAIVGAVYDFRDDYGHGQGRLVVLNLNGEKDPKKIQDSHYFDNLENVAIGVESAPKSAK